MRISDWSSDVCSSDLAEDMLAILAYLAQESTTYANAWGYEAAMRALVEQKRDLDYRPMLDEAHAVLAQGIDNLRFAAVRASSGTDQGKARDRLAGELHKLAPPPASGRPEARNSIVGGRRVAVRGGTGVVVNSKKQR